MSSGRRSRKRDNRNNWCAQPEHEYQSTQQVIIDWNTFNIGADASVRFYQPNSDALAVNRVNNSNQFTRINGKLTANGKVMILDPNGVMFGAGSIVDVGAIVASIALFLNLRLE